MLRLSPKNSLRIALGMFCFSIIVYQTQCAKKFEGDSYSPSTLPVASITGASANGGGAFYCSISGGCPLTITGTNLYKYAKVYVGPYECLNTTVSETFTQIDCTVGPAQNGVYDIRVKNVDGQYSAPFSTQFSYASFLYVGSAETPGRVYGYAQHPTTGALLTISGSPFSISGHNLTYGVAISPNNRYLYAANVNSNTVSVFSINPLTGALTAVGVPVNSGGTRPNGLFFHPSGNFLFVTNQTGNSVSVFAVASDGNITAIAGSPFTTTGATFINGVVVTADGKFLYAASGGGNGGIAGFSIDETTGALTVIPGSPFLNTLGGDATNPGDGISIHPNAQWIYMGLYSRRKIAAWSIDQTPGVLTPIEPPTLNNATTGYVDDNGSASTVSADGLFLYGTAFSSNGSDPKKIVVYAIDQSTGGLSRVSEVDTSSGPNDVRIDTTGNFAYTCNTPAPASINAYSVNKTTGALTALTPPSYSIPAPGNGPGIMVMQRSSATGEEEEEEED